MTALKKTFLPELGNPIQGKVREIYETKGSLTMIASDRVSIFDRVLNEPIQDKGRVLTELSLFWFEKTKDIIANHVLGNPDPNVMVVRKCRPLKVEMIVRAHIAGSLWQDYSAGSRVKCGVPLPDGLKKHDALPELIVTPTTKAERGHDEDITPQELIDEGVVTAEEWQIMEEASLALFRRGQEVLKDRGIIFVDTKYEFGIDPDGDLVLIDEIHTPDSSRFWFESEHSGKQLRYPDKEFVREWGREQDFLGEGTVPTLPEEICRTVTDQYREVFSAITGRCLPHEKGGVAQRLLKNLKDGGIIKGRYALILAGSEKDQAHVDKITAVLEENDTPHGVVISSAHKSPKEVMRIIDDFNDSLEPVVIITVAGRSNALSGVVAANSRWPVIACPPFKDQADYLANIHSSLQMPSMVPAMTVIDPGNAALAAVKILRTMGASL